MISEEEKQGIAEAYREEGWHEGHEAGIKQGIEVGRAEGKAEGKAEGIAEERERLLTALRSLGVLEDMIILLNKKEYSLSM